MILAGDFNINALDYEQNKKVQSFFNLMYRYNMIPTINKPTRVGKNSATAIDHIIANCIVDCQFKTAILKTDVTDHFRIAMTLKTDEPVHQSQKYKMYTAVTTMKRPSNHLTNDFENMTGPNFINARIPMKHINIFLKHLFQFMIIFSQK